jgi:sulfoxide reductase heme-binding subunit YedZ
MNTRTIRILKPFVFLVSLLPFFYLLRRAQTQDLGADPVQYITHFTGNWAMYSLLLSLAITPVRRISPKLAWLIRFRRMLGLFAFFYATLHLLTYLLLFSGFDLAGAWTALGQHDFASIRGQWLAVWPTILDDLQKRRFVQVGLLSWTILFLLALTSPQRVLRWMGGKPWQALHRSVYVAAALAVVHFWWSVKKGVLEPWKDTAVLTALLLARVGYSLANRKTPPAKQPVPPAKKAQTAEV